MAIILMSDLTADQLQIRRFITPNGQHVATNIWTIARGIVF